MQQLLVDVWEGSLDINEPILKAGGVKGFIIRLNDMNGGHHEDKNFKNQWAQAESFLRAPYFVYNPWVSGMQNFYWMADHLPSGVTRLFSDVEVSKPDYSPEVYADELQIFTNETMKEWSKLSIYTGQWFLPLVAHWPKIEYWWARYPYEYYPPTRENWTWERLQTSINKTGYKPDPLKKCPGIPNLWQFSGDRLILPGTADRPIDTIAFNGTDAELEVYWGAELPQYGLTYEQKVDILWEQAILHDWIDIP